MYRFNPADQLHTGTIFYGPAPAPRAITHPRVHVLDGDAYGQTQCDETIKTGDVLVAGDGDDRVVGVMMEAWPIALHGSDDAVERIGFHRPSPDAELSCFGQQGWGRLMDMRYFPPEGPAEGIPFTDYSAPRGGYDVRLSASLAAATAGLRLTIR